LAWQHASESKTLRLLWIPPKLISKSSINGYKLFIFHSNFSLLEGIYHFSFRLFLLGPPSHGQILWKLAGVKSLATFWRPSHKKKLAGRID
jgi:hypothetical protein